MFTTHQPGPWAALALPLHTDPDLQLLKQKHTMRTDLDLHQLQHGDAQAQDALLVGKLQGSAMQACMAAQLLAVNFLCHHAHSRSHACAYSYVLAPCPALACVTAAGLHGWLAEAMCSTAKQQAHMHTAQCSLGALGLGGKSCLWTGP